MKKGLMIGLAVVLVAVIAVVGWTVSKQDKTGDKKAEDTADITTIKDKKYTDGDIQALDNKVDGYQYEVKDNLLEKVLEEYYPDVNVDEDFENYKKHTEKDGVTWTDEEEKKIKKQMRYSKQIQSVYDKLIPITEEEVEKVTKDGYPIVEVEHAIINPEKYAKDKTIVGTVKEELNKAVTDEEYQKLRDKWEKDETVSMVRSQMSKETVINGFEEILDEKVGSVKPFGQDNYMSVMKVVEKRNATKEEVHVGLRNGRILLDFPTVEDLLYGMEKEYKGLHFSKGVRAMLEADAVGQAPAVGEEPAEEEQKVTEEQKEEDQDSDTVTVPADEEGSKTKDKK